MALKYSLHHGKSQRPLFGDDEVVNDIHNDGDAVFVGCFFMALANVPGQDVKGIDVQAHK